MWSQQKPSLLIIGAGATGLLAASELAEDYQVTVIEALNRIGGRIHTLHSKNNSIIEVGAEFVHGDLPITKSLVKKAGLTLEKAGGKMYRVSNCEWQLQDEMIAGWDELMDQLKSLKEDLTLDGFLETHFPGAEYEALRRHARNYACGFDLADPTRVSAMSLYREWSAEMQTQYRLKEGYQSLIHYLVKLCEEKGCNIVTNKRVKQIDWQQNEVTALTIDNEKFTAEKIVITLPAGVLQETVSYASINLSPALDEYEQSWKNIGYGSVLKVMLVFKKSFWKKEKEDIGFIFSEETIPTWWTQGSSDDTHLLTGWLGGPAAMQWDTMSDEAIIQSSLASLSKIFRIDIDELARQLSEHFIARWHHSKTASGAYSYETPLSKNAKELLNTPVNNTLFFAGEALYSGPYPGTVEAAFTSALETVKKIRKEQ